MKSKFDLRSQLDELTAFLAYECSGVTLFLFKQPKEIFHYLMTAARSLLDKATKPPLSRLDLVPS